MLLFEQALRQGICALLAIFLLTGLSAGHAYADKIDTLTDTIEICVDESPGLIEPDGSGMWYALFRKIYAPHNIQLKVLFEPYIRCEEKLKLNATDMVPGVYPDSAWLVPDWFLGIDFVTVVFKKGKMQWEGEKSLHGKRVSWKRGYKMDEYGVISVPVKKHEYDRKKSVLAMLMLERIDYLLDYQPEIGITIEQLGLSEKLVTVENAIQGGHYYVGFANTAKGKQLKSIFNQGMQRLFASGELQEMFQAIGDPSY